MKKLLLLLASSILMFVALGCSSSGTSSDTALEDKTADAGKTAATQPAEKSQGIPAPAASGLDPTK